MSAPSPANLRDRIRRSLSPVVLGRTAGLGALAMIVALGSALVALLVLGLAGGDNLSDTATGALVEGAGVNVIVYGAAILAAVLGVLSTAFLHASAQAGDRLRVLSALKRAAVVAPRLVAALLLLALAALVAVVGWLPLTLVALVSALVLQFRHWRRMRTLAGSTLDGTPDPTIVRSRSSARARRALIWAIPFLPLAASIALAIAVVPASLSRPASVRALLHAAAQAVRTRKRSLALLTLGVGSVTVAVGLGGAAAAAAVRGESPGDVSPETVVSFLLLVVFTIAQVGFAGAAIATTVPSDSEGAALPAAGPSSARPVERTTLTPTPNPAPVFRIAHRLTSTRVLSAPTAHPAGPASERGAGGGLFARVFPALRILSMALAVAVCSTLVSPLPASADPAAQRTEITATLQTDSRVGPDMPFDVTVSTPDDPTATGLTGDVEVYDGTTLLISTALASTQYGLYIPTSSLNAGPLQLRFVFVPGAGFLGSETTADVDMQAAFTSMRITATPSSGSEITWGESHTLSADVTAEVDGPRTLVVRDGVYSTSPEVARVEFSVTDGAATVPVDLTRVLPPGAHKYRAEVLATANSASAGTDEYSIRVSEAPTTVALTVTGPSEEPTKALVGRPLNLQATVASTNSGAASVPGEVIFTVNGSPQTPTPVGSNGVATATFTPTSLTPLTITAAYSDTSTPRIFGSSSSSTVSRTVGLSTASWTSRWFGDLTLSDTQLEIVYGGAAGLPKPTGTVVVYDYHGGVAGLGTLVDGVLTTSVKPVPGSAWYTARYSGDSWFAPLDIDLYQVAEAYKPKITVTAPGPAPLSGEAFTVDIAVDGVPRTSVKSVTVTDQSQDSSGTVGVVTLDANGKGSLSVKLAAPGAHDLRVEVTYVAGTALPTTTSDPLRIDVQPALVPDLRVTTTTPADQILPGKPIDVVVTAHTLPGRTTTGLASGTTVTVNGLSVVLLPSPEGLRGSVQLQAPEHGGILTLQASATYGLWNWTVRSPAVDVTVPPPVTELIVVPTTGTIVGEYLTVEVTAYLPAGFSSSLRNVSVQVNLAGQNLYGEAVPVLSRAVSISRSSDTGPLSGSLRLPMGYAGSYTVTANLAGDGVNIGQATAKNGAIVERRATGVFINTTGLQAAGRDLQVGANILPVTNPTVSIGYPSGSVSISSSGLSCATTPATPCILPGAAIRAGTNTLLGTYTGDANYEASQGRFVIQAAARWSNLDVSYSPTPDLWLDGSSVTVSWNTTTYGAAPAGLVTARIGDASCEGRPVDGSCVLKIPERKSGAYSTAVGYSIAFTSSDDAPSISRYVGTVVPQGCFYPTVSGGTIDLTGATTCERNGRPGVTAGSVITVTPDTPPQNYVVTGLASDNNFIRAVPGSTSYTLTVGNDHRISFSLEYKPICFTLTLSPAAADTFQAGKLTSLTPPNCADPNTPTKEELAAQAAGKPRYAAGTDVRLFAGYPIPSSPIANAAVPGSGLSLELMDLDGAAMTDGSEHWAHVVMDQDRSVTATFKVHECLALSIEKNEGGTLAVESSQRPYTSRDYQPSSGACTTVSGDPGFVPGTRVTLRATADADTFLESIGEAGGHCANPASTRCDLVFPSFPLHIVGSEKLKRATSTMSVTVDKSLLLGAQFAAIRCVQITSVTNAQIGQGYATDDYRTSDGNWVSAASEAVSGVSLALTRDDGSTEVGCGGNKSTSSDSVQGISVQRTESVWLVQSGSIAVSTEYSSIGFGKTGSSVVNWGTNRGEPVTRQGVQGGRTGPVISLADVDPGFTITADWYASDCKLPVNNPQGGTFVIVELQPADLCPEGVMSPRQQTGWIQANPLPDAPNLSRIFSIDALPWPNLYPEVAKEFTPAADGRWYSQSDWGVHLSPVLQQLNFRAEYCAPLQLEVYEVDDKDATNGFSGDISQTVGDNGGCPPGWAQAGRQVGIGLSSWGNYSYTLIKNSDGAAPQVTLDAQGNQIASAGLPLRLKVRCQTVNLSDAWFVTPSNCPGGGSNRFLRGAVVQMQTDIDDLETFNGWTGAAQTSDFTAWVVASEDRSVAAHIDRPSEGVRFVNTMTNAVQRGLSLAVTLLTEALLSKLAIVQGISLALKGVTTALHAVGVEGKVLDALDKGAEIIDKQVEMIKLMSTCMQKWSSGSSKTPVRVLPPPPAFTGSDITGQLSRYLESTVDEGAEVGLNTLAKRNKVATAFATNIG
ncbi:MAG: hypothetical protein ABWX96_09945, partial [Propionibacteriaceae bacterium]